MGFLTFLVFVLIVAVVVLAVRVGAQTDQVEELRRRLGLAELDLFELKRGPKPKPAEQSPLPPLPPAPTPSPQPAATPALPPPLPPVIAPALATVSAETGKQMEPVLVMPPSAPPSPPLPTAPARPEPSRINWEQFMGVKLFAWIGGFVLFLGMAFAIKYSFEQGWFSKELRVAAGYVAGLCLVVGGTLIPRARYALTVQALTSAGILTLYAVTFSAQSPRIYDLLPAAVAFPVMVAITVAAFFLAVRLDAQAVAVLALLGGFLTPPLLSRGEDHAFALFSYIAVLDAGLIAVALSKRWTYLATLGALGTMLTEFGWTSNHFEPTRIHTAVAIFLTFVGLFTAGFAAAAKRERDDGFTWAATLVPAFAAFLFALSILGSSRSELGARPGLMFSFVFLVDAALLVMAWLRDKLRLVQFAGGAAVFLLLSVWTLGHVNAALLNWALGFYLLFGVLHSVFPVWLSRQRPGAAPGWWAHCFPPVALLLTMLPILKFDSVSLLVWPVILLVDALAIGLAVMTASAVAVVVALVFTVAATGLWLLRVPAATMALPDALAVIGGFAVFFFVAGVVATKKILAKLAANATESTGDAKSAAPVAATLDADLVRQVPALSAILPFLLLTMLVLKLRPADPSPVFGLAAVMIALLLGLVRSHGADALAAVGLGCALLLEHAWHVAAFAPGSAVTPLAWYAGFGLVFLVFPFLFPQRFAGRMLPWAVSALSLPLHFYIAYRGFKEAYPDCEFAGLVPAGFALVALGALARIIPLANADASRRNALLALFGGAALFFITLIVPVQFDKEWITLGWAVEGAALLWLFHRVPHDGLRVTGVALLLVAFARLALNPAVFVYHERSVTPVFNWYLYAYGLATCCLAAGARLLAPPRNVVLGCSAPAVLNTLAAILGFWLVNIEIADYFSTGSKLTFRLTGGPRDVALPRDMTCSLAWALYAFGVLAMGVKARSRGARWAGLGLLVVTIVKLFLHDLWALGDLYRVGALIGLAVVLILVSVIYQRFVAPLAEKPEPDETGKR